MAEPGAPENGSVMSETQRAVLRNQVALAKVFKLSLKAGTAMPVPAEWLAQSTPPPLGQPRSGVRDLVADANKFRTEWTLRLKQAAMQRQNKNNGGGAVPSGRSTPPGLPVPSPPNAQQQDHPARDSTPGYLPVPSAPEPVAGPSGLREVKVELRRGPIYTVAGPTRQNGQEQEIEGALQSAPLNANVAALIQGENQRMMERRLKERISTLEALAADPTLDPGMKYRGPRPPVGAVLLQLRSLKALEKQRQLRAIVDAEGREVVHMPDKQYRMLMRSHRNLRIETARKDIAARAELAAARARDVKAFRTEVMPEVNAAARELRVARNRLVSRAHERLARERNKQKDDDRSLRMEALKAHDFEAYQEMLRRQTGSLPAAGERYEAISKFLADTEAYLDRLAGKIASVKVSAEAATAMTQAMEKARAQGMSEEEVQAAGRAAAAEAASGSEAVRAAVEGAGDAQSRYYQLAHSNTEEITDQPTMLRPPNGAKLREYQIVGLQWMVSLYNNHLNGILADEMGLGKTVQVMALIAYLMEKKSNYGPHLIIVPNAVIVNWKSELTQWLPNARCVYYVGQKDERARKYVQEVQPLQFNILVTTYEFIMRDRTKLSKIDWQYIIIDEAQRMKDRQSKLAKDLDRFTAARRLLLSGTPLQNDLQELWSLLNLLLPDVFDDKKIFSEWFGDHISGGANNGGGDDWLEKEKRVVVIHRLHQILEPFMLRRQVEDVESKLPPKVAHTVHVAMSAHQSAIYTWVKATGTLRLDPAAPMIGKVAREWANLQNKCMELRKVCNHPLLSYPPPSWAVGQAIVRQCGKMVALDRMLVKLKASGHRVLLFSTMTKLLDLLEVYLQWRELPACAGGGRMQFLRIDGSTSLEDREAAIQRFNAKDSDAFIFLLSIRAAGRGLNLQSADTVVIYDPDPNPKNEEQAIARSHRIGQTKEVRVFHLEAVADAPGSVPMRDGPGTEEGAGTGANGEESKRLYADSIESIVRGQIQRMKIEMANEVIDAGRFDQQTSMEERRQTLETLLQDPERQRKATNEVPTWAELNVMLARTDGEKALFEKMDREEKWFDPTHPSEVQRWMQWSEADLRAAMESNAKLKVDVEAEIAALTGTVLHHHVPASAAKKAVGGPEAVPGVVTARPSAEPAVTTLTTTTTRSVGGEGEEEEEVAMEDNDEEEEVLEQNLVTDDVTEGVPGGSAPSGISAEPGNGSIKRIPSTAGTLATPQSAPSAATVGEKRPGEDAVGGGSGGVGPDGEEQGLKRRRVLSVHFEDTDMQEAAAAEGAPAPPNSHPQEQHEQVNGGS